MTLGPYTVRSSTITPEQLRALPTSARPVVDPSAVVVPDGYRVEALPVGLNVPCGIAVGDDGTVYIAEGGSTWPTRPGMPPRILFLSPEGNLDVFVSENLAGPRGMTVHDGYLYAAAKGGYFS